MSEVHTMMLSLTIYKVVTSLPGSFEISSEGFGF
jgi:hypothetical protein